MKINNRSVHFEEKWYRVSKNESFKKSIAEFRKMFDLPLGGFESTEKWDQWAQFVGEWTAESFSSKLFLLHVSVIKEFKLTQDFYQKITDYVLFGSNKITSVLSEYGCEIVNEVMRPDLYMLPEGIAEGVMLRITPDATRNDVQRFIKLRWKDIEQWKKGINKPKTIRKSYNKERDDLIHKYNEKPLAELNKAAGREIPFKYKWDCIAYILKTKYGLGVTGVNVRQIASRQKRQRH